MFKSSNLYKKWQTHKSGATSQADEALRDINEEVGATKWLKFSGKDFAMIETENLSHHGPASTNMYVSECCPWPRKMKDV